MGEGCGAAAGWDAASVSRAAFADSQLNSEVKRHADLTWYQMMLDESLDHLHLLASTLKTTSGSGSEYASAQTRTKMAAGPQGTCSEIHQRRAMIH